MVPARVTLGCAVALSLAAALAACTVGPGTASPSGSASGSSSTGASAGTGDTTSGTTGEPCVPGPDVDLGRAAFDVAPRGFVRVTAGRFRLQASGFPHGGLLDPKVGRTSVVWGDASTTPTYAPGPATVAPVAGQVDVVEGEDAWVDLPEGTWWFLSSNGVRLTLAACPPATATRVPG